jgi:multimeric flavodoxin WrbA
MEPVNDERELITLKERVERARSAPPGRKKIIALVCGSENGQCETFTRAAAMGAEEFGVETEIIRAATLNVNVLEGDPNDDVPWIHEKTLLEDAALICAVPCYHARANALFYAINERMNSMMREDQYQMNKVNRVGAVIGVGGSGYDADACLTVPSVEIFMQHTCKIVDQAQFNFCGLKEWNLWMQQGQPLRNTLHTGRINDVDHEVGRAMYGEQVGSHIEWYTMAIERAKQMGRNVAQAMDMPIEEVTYKGEASGVECPVCHCRVVLVQANLPHIWCPVDSTRGTLVVDNDGKMKVEWNMDDTKNPRYHYQFQLHHAYWLQEEFKRRSKDRDEYDALRNSLFSNSKAKIIRPHG